MEERLNQGEEIRREHRRSSKVIFAVCAVGALLLAIAILTSILLLLFPVSEIEVTGDSRYSYSQIIEASGIRKGSRLYYINESKAEARILEAMPYLENVKVNSYFPNRVKIEIEEFDDVYLAPHTGGLCYVNGDFEILEIIDTAPSFESFSGVYIKLEGAVSGEIGDVYDGEDSQRAKQLIEYLKEYGFYQYLNIVDVEQKYDISFVVNKKYKFVIGAIADVGEKIDIAFKVCFTDEFKRDQNCIIDATDKKRVVLRYISDEIILEEFDFCQN